MDKAKVVKWLEAYILPPDVRDEDSALLAREQGITLEEAQEMVAECEERSIEMFLEWYNEVAIPEEVKEDA